MKLQLDTTNKTIKLEDKIKFSDLIETLEKILPEQWKDFTLETNVVINNWTNPYIIEKQVPVYPNYPWYNGATNITSSFDENTKFYTLNQGTYNIEV